MREPRTTALVTELAAIVAATAVLLAPGTSSAQPGAVEEQSQPSVDAPRVLFVATDGMSEQALLEALALRAPKHPRVGLQSKTQVTTPEQWVYINVDTSGSNGVLLTLILEDGRAFDRTIEPGEVQELPRATAVGIANLLAAIEEQRVVADRHEIAPPQPLPIAESEPAPEPEVQQLPEPEPEPAPEPVASESKPPPAKQAAVDWGPILLGGVAVGIGPPTIESPFLGGGGTLRVDVRWRRGGLLGVGAGAMGLSRSGLALVRYRIGVLGGYNLRVKRFELSTAAGVFVEPWQLRGGSELVVFQGESEEDLPSVSLGVNVRVEPGLRIQTKRGAVRLFAWGELAAVGVIDEGLRAVELSISESDSGFRVGGIEAAFGLGIGLWLPGRPR